MLNITASRRGRREPPGLNIAPLIDMVFILLIFFLVNTSFTKETGIDVDRREIDLRAVRANVERALAENPEGDVVVVADKASSTGVAIQVMDGCRMAGAEQVSLAASLPEAR
jgi:biopolymer transport protein ExbD